MAYNSVSEVENAIARTVIYSDIFHFPLTKDEVWRFLISEKPVSYPVFLEALQHLPPVIVLHNGYYVMSGRESLVAKRRSQQSFLAKKIEIAKRAAFYLSHIPTIRFIGISGGVAMKNVAEDSDVDLFFITQKGTVFMTRLWVLAVLEWLGLRRKRNEKNPVDKICANLFIDEAHLTWPVRKRDVYTAHEISQVVPLFQRDNCYKRFLESNSWVTTLRPNCQGEQPLFLRSLGNVDYVILRLLGKIFFSAFFETISRGLQRLVMKKHQTTELIGKHILALHPNDYRVTTLEELSSKYEKIGLLTKV